MTATPNLQIDYIAAAQAQKEVTANAAFEKLDRALCGLTEIALSDADLTLTDAQMLGAVSLIFTGALTAVRAITFPSRAKLLIVENATTGGFDLTLNTASGTPITLSPGIRKLLYCNGTTLKPVAEISITSSQPYDIGGSFSGKPTDNLVLLRYPMPRAVRIPTGMASSNGVIGTAPTASASFTLNKNGTAFATMNFAIGAASATFTCVADTDFAIGDVLTLTAPSTADTTLADLGFALACLRI